MSDNNDIPKDYFDKLPDKIMEKINHLEDDIIKNAPLLSKIGNKVGYDLPENYFEHLGLSLEKPKSQSTVKTVYFRLSLIAASFCLILASVFVFNSYQDASVASTEDIVEEDILDYYLEYADELEEEFIYELEDVAFEEVSYLNGITDLELEQYIEMTLEDFSLEEIDQLF